MFNKGLNNLLNVVLCVLFFKANLLASNSNLFICLLNICNFKKNK